jgi:hypothetical protein
MTDTHLLWPLNVVKRKKNFVWWNNKQNLLLLASLNFFLALGVKKKLVPHNRVGRCSSVGIVTRYGLGGPEIESR